MAESQVHLIKMISTNKAIDLIKSSIKHIGHERINVYNSLGRILQKPITAKNNNPPFNASSMDGYAINLNKNKANAKVFKVVNEIFAGEYKNTRINNEEAIRIYTGSTIPKGSNTVVLQENVKELKNNFIMLLKKAYKNQFIRKQGQDYKKGTVLFKKGHKINARDIGLIISAGISKISVYKKPKVAVIATGSELITPENNIGKGKIFASSLYVIKELINLSEARCCKTLIVKDNNKLIKKSIKNLKDIDLLITTGGVSVGKKDLVKASLLELGFKQVFWKISVKPGKPLLFGFIKDIPVFGLPGNPVSSFVCFLLFVTKALEKLQSNNTPLVVNKEAILLQNLSNRGDRQSYIRGQYKLKNNKFYVKALMDQDSSLLNNLSIANCLIIINPRQNFKKNQKVKIIKFPKGF